MPLHPRGTVALRGICVLLSVYAATALAWLQLARPVAARALSQMPFEDALLFLCAVGLTASAGWLAITTTVVVAEAVAHPVRGVPHGTLGARICPLPIRRMILVTCGVALGAAMTPTAFADAPGSADHRAGDQQVVSVTGLAVPDRAVGSMAGTTGTPASAVKVRHGDSLWSIAERSQGAGTSDAEVATVWRAIYAHNLAGIGENPDLILPGSRLEMPESLATQRKELR